MKLADVRGVRKSKRVFTARPDKALALPADHGSNHTAMDSTDRIVELGAVPSTGTVGDSFDNAMAEAVNSFYKTELIRQQGPWRTVEQVELVARGSLVVAHRSGYI